MHLWVQSRDYVFRPSALMDHAEAEKWLHSIRHTQQCINSILSLISPELYARGKEAILTLKKDHTKLFGQVPKSREDSWPQTLRSLAAWCTVFSGMAIIANRFTPSHRDDRGHAYWYDLLFSAGCHSDALFKALDSAGIQLRNWCWT